LSVKIYKGKNVKKKSRTIIIIATYHDGKLPNGTIVTYHMTDYKFKKN